MRHRCVPALDDLAPSNRVEVQALIPRAEAHEIEASELHATRRMQLGHTGRAEQLGARAAVHFELGSTGHAEGGAILRVAQRTHALCMQRLFAPNLLEP